MLADESVTQPGTLLLVPARRVLDFPHHRRHFENRILFWRSGSSRTWKTGKPRSRKPSLTVMACSMCRSRPAISMATAQTGSR